MPEWSGTWTITDPSSVPYTGSAVTTTVPAYATVPDYCVVTYTCVSVVGTNSLSEAGVTPLTCADFGGSTITDGSISLAATSAQYTAKTRAPDVYTITLKATVTASDIDDAGTNLSEETTVTYTLEDPCGPPTVTAPALFT